MSDSNGRICNSIYVRIQSITSIATVCHFVIAEKPAVHSWDR